MTRDQRFERLGFRGISERALRVKRRRRARAACERLERRRLLTSFVVNGTGGNDFWTVSTSGGFIFVNNFGSPEAGYSDIVVNGLGGVDQVDLGSTDLPLTFNGGDGDDVISDQVHHDLSFNQQLTFNGGTGNDEAWVYDNFYATNTTYTFFGNELTRAGFGGLTFSNDVDQIFLQTGQADMAVYVQALTIPSSIDIYGHHNGNESVYVNMNGGTGAVNYFGNNTGVGDTLQVDDYNYTGGLGYNINESQIYHPSIIFGRIVGYGGCSSLTLQGSGTNANTYHVFRMAAGCATAILGGTANDTFIVDGGDAAADNIQSPLSIYGAGGSDSMSYTYATYTGPADTFYLTPTLIYRSGGFATTYDGIENLSLTGPNSDSNYQITGTSAQITGQTTLFAGGGNNFIDVFNRDAAGNPTIPTNLGIVGGGGTSDIVDISSGTSATPDSYVLNNPFGTGTADVSGVGAGLIGAASDVEVIVVEGGPANDSFRLDTFKSGNALWVKGNDGDDTFDLCPLTGSLPGNLTNMSSFLFSGGTGSDTLRVHNENNTSAWTYTRGNQFVTAVTSTYAVNLSHEQTETLFLAGGTVADTFNINNSLDGATTIVDGGRDFDHLAVHAPGARIASPQRFADVLIDGSGTVAIDPAGGANTVLTRSLSITASARLDLADNTLIDDYSGASPIGSLSGATYTGVTGLLQSGRNGGAWDGPGIGTSLASGSFTIPGIAEATQAPDATDGTFASESVDTTAVLVKFTYGGDANLDGKINVDDYGKIDFNVPLGANGWFNGDFNYDGKINVDDYGIIDFNVGIQGPPLGNEPAGTRAATAPTVGLNRPAVVWAATDAEAQRRRDGAEDLLGAAV